MGEIDGGAWLLEGSAKADGGRRRSGWTLGAAALVVLCSCLLPHAAGQGRGETLLRKEPARVRAAQRFMARRGVGPTSRLRGGRNSGAAAVPLASGSPVWTAVGPVAVNSLSYGLVTGRVSAVAVDPSDATGNHVYVGTTGGGLWKSQNAAASAPGSVQFMPVTDGLGALSNVVDAGVSVGAVTVQPGGTGVVLAGLGDPNDALDSYYGAGLLRSTDGGLTWALIQQTMDLEDGLSAQDYSFVGEGFSGFAWSSTNVQLVVAAVSQAYEGTLVNAGQAAKSYEGLYWSNDGGATWHLARISDPNGQDVQGPGDAFTLPDGNAATAVVWNPVRRVFVAAVRYHGYYQSSDGENWTRLGNSPNGQPGTGLSMANCPTEAGSVGVAGCPIFRGSLAVNPQTGDTFAWTVDAFNQDQGIWQDQCGLSGSACTNQTMTFGVRLGTSALEEADGDGAVTIANGDYNLTLSAVPAGLGTGQDTLLFAGDNDLWKCSLANGCVWRNTTNSTTCMSAQVGEYQHALAWDTGNPLLLFVGTDGGLWRSMDGVSETGTVCTATDAGHWQNLNGSLGAPGGLAEMESLAQSSATAATMLAGLGANGFAGIVNAPATAGNWNEVLGGEGGPVAIDPTNHLNSWYASNGAGVSILHCTSATAGAACTSAGFGASPVVGEAQVQNDGLTMPYPAEFELDAVDPSQMLVGTCRVWRGPATGSGWTAANAISPILDGTGGTTCNGNALIRSIATLGTTGGGEVVYVGMAGAEDGGGIVAGHVFAASVPPGANWSGLTWTDLAFSPVANSGLAFNPFGEEVSSVYVDPHDVTGGTVYVTVAGISSASEQVQQVYQTTDGGAHWTAIASNLPNSPANAVVVDTQDPNTVYVGMDTGVYVTRAVSSCALPLTSGGSCWSVYGTGLPLAPVTTLVATPSGAVSQVLTAGTYGRGVWQIPTATAGAVLTTATVSPTSLTFPNQTVGTATAALTVTLKTTGTAALTVTSIGMTGIAAGDFSETDTCSGVSVAKNATCAVKVVFQPTAAGSRSGTLTISANVAGGQLLVPLTGAGLATSLVTMLPTSLSFGQQQVGTTSAAQNITIQNVSSSSIGVNSVAPSAPFKKGVTTCVNSLAAGQSCVVGVTFAPTQVGDATGNLTVTDSLGTQSAPLSGTGIAGPTDTLSTTSLTFPSTAVGQTSAPMVVQITNSGALPLTNIGTAVTGDFTAVSGCGGQLGANASCAVSVTFSPTLAKPEAGNLVISDALRAQTVKLGGTGLAPGVIAVFPQAFNFGSQQIDMATAEQTLRISDTGGVPLAQPSFSISGPGAANFLIGTTTCGTSVAPGSPCTVQVIFDPLASGATAAMLTVATSSPGVAAVTLNLTGTGLTPPTLRVVPASLNLGQIVIGYSSTTFSVQVTNTGQETMSQPTFALSGFSGPAGSQIGDFALSAPTDIPACTGTLNPAGSCSIQVTLSPLVVGTESATLTVTASNAIPSTATVSLTGVALPPILLQANPLELSFTATPVGTSSAGLGVTLSNLGKQAANGLTLSVTGPYVLTPTLTTCGTKLSQSSSCVVGVSFVPTASGDQLGTLTAAVSNLGVPPLVIPLDGTGIAVGGIQPSPTQMTFGSVVVQTPSTAQTLTVKNSGQASITGLLLSITGDYSLANNLCGTSLAAQASCTAGVVLTPVATGNRVGSMTISTTSAGVAPAVVGLTGNGIAPESMTLNPAVVSFGTVTVGQSSPPQQVMVSNAGATALTGLQFQVAGDYSMPQNNCGTQLASGALCSFMVTFSPAQPGTRIGSVTIQSTTSGFVPVVAGLSGTGLPTAQLTVTPSQLVFGSVTAGTNSTALQLTVTNPGTSTLSGLSFATASPFSVGSGSCGTSLVAGGTCGVPVTFTPKTGGNQAGTVTVSSTSVGVDPVLVPATGTGVAPASLNVNPTALTFAGTTVGKTSAGQTITISNPGGLPLAGLTVEASGDFGVNSTNCGPALAGGGGCTATVIFTPTVTGGRQGFFTAASTTTGVSPISAELSGTGLTPPALSIAPTALTFAPTLVGHTSATQTVAVTNSGQSSITDLQLSVTGGFRVDTTETTCTATLAAGANCTVGLLFAPTAGGAVTGAITASSPSSGSPAATASLSGTGALPPGIVSSPAALVQFGTTGVGQAGGPVTVTVTNAGTSSALTGLTLTIDAAGTANGFGLSNNGCGTTATPGSLAAVEHCTADITFKPTSTGLQTGTMLIVSANGGSPVSLALEGIGFDFRFTLVGSSTATVVRGQTAYYNFAVTPLGGNSGGGAFSFSCANLPSNTLCVFNPPQLGGLGTNVTGNVTLGVATGAATTGANIPHSQGRGGGSDWRGTMLLICGVLTMPLLWRKRSASYHSVTRLVLLTIVTIEVALGITSCASAGMSSSELQPGGGTPPGSYTVPVTATSVGVSHSFQVKLVVN